MCCGYSKHEYQDLSKTFILNFKFTQFFNFYPKEVTISRKSGKSPKRPKPSKGDINQNNLRERLQKLRKMANAKNRGNEVRLLEC